MGVGVNEVFCAGEDGDGVDYYEGRARDEGVEVGDEGWDGDVVLAGGEVVVVSRRRILPSDVYCRFCCCFGGGRSVMREIGGIVGRWDDGGWDG